MTFLTFLSVFNYGLVLLFGLFLSTFFSGGWKNQKQKHILLVGCLIFLLIQSVCWLSLSVGVTKKLYPFIVHLPLVLILVIGLKKPAGLALVSVCTAYLCCQIPRWVNLVVTGLTDSPLAGEFCYTLTIIPLFFLLHRFLVRAAHDAMTSSISSLILFGSLPVAYYIFDYATVIYSNALHSGIIALDEFLPTALIVFYVIFLSAYHAQTQERLQENLRNSMMEAELEQVRIKMENLRQTERNAAIYQHDMRHHLTAIAGFLYTDKIQEAKEYIQRVQEDVESIMPKCFCENELVNMLCTSFSDRAERMGIRLAVKAKISKIHSISDTELCTVLSNGLENALHAVSELEKHRWIEMRCEVKHDKLLIGIKNPYSGEIIMQDGLPVSGKENHGYGCYSIRAIVERHQGVCDFETKNGIFILRVVLPVYENALQKEI